MALRDRIAAVIDGASPRDVVGLSRRLLDISGELTAMDARAADEAERTAEPEPDWNPGEL